MNQLVKFDENGLISTEEFFAPIEKDLLQPLLSGYIKDREAIDQVHKFLNQGGLLDIVDHFIQGNKSSETTFSFERKYFEKAGAIRSLNSAYWSKAISLTDVYQIMPEARRNEWNEAIKGKTTPDFFEQTVTSTLAKLLMDRPKYLAERVDGIFRGLSRSHVTNTPQGFNARMIMEYAFPYGSVDYRKAGLVNDLRSVIGRFQGRGEIQYNLTGPILDRLYKNDTGTWHSIDGGSLRVRVYKKGTIHLEVHPEVAWRLNEVLATLYPMAIPTEFRTKPKTRSREFNHMQVPLPFDVIRILSSIYATRGSAHRLFMDFTHGNSSPAAKRAIEVLESIGGVVSFPTVTFEYPAMSTIHMIVETGVVPDQKSHQAYFTPSWLAAAAVNAANIGETDKCLEPSAGIGNIAGLLPKDRTTCVEVSPLHCEALRAGGFNVIQSDFIEWAKLGWKYDRIVMNPPYSDNRWRSHLAAALDCLKENGVLVAILPASVTPGFKMPGANCTEIEFEVSPPIEKAFEDASVNVVIAKTKKVSH